MSTAKTTADLFRERGWEVGTKVELEGNRDSPFNVTAIGRRYILAVGPDGREWAFECTVEGWSLYRPTPPVPTQEEWRDLWAKLEAWRAGRTNPPASHFPETTAVICAIDALKAKVQP